MAKSQKLEQTLSTLKSIRNDPTAESAVQALRQVLKSKFGVAVAQAAKLVGDAELYDLKPDLAAAFERLMDKPQDRDPGCQAKERIAEALYKLEFSNEQLFLQGIHHVQLEATWGGQIDTAAGLRGICALGLVRMNYPEVMVELADLLCDPDPSARAMAAKAIAYTENRDGVPLLRLKARIGDSHPQVLSECFIGLLKLAPEQSLPFVAQYLDLEQSSSEMAALALGESQLEAAFPILQQSWEHSHLADFRRTVLIAIALFCQTVSVRYVKFYYDKPRICEKFLPKPTTHQKLSADLQPLYRKI
ncbi:MAG: HEAT repeat domain-containing protein [Elainellaceae cyanobacterium]